MGKKSSYNSQENGASNVKMSTGYSKKMGIVVFKREHR